MAEERDEKTAPQEDIDDMIFAGETWQVSMR